jgi:hypothetical protein
MDRQHAADGQTARCGWTDSTLRMDRQHAEQQKSLGAQVGKARLGLQEASRQ